jgi:hypothetical protein
MVHPRMPRCPRARARSGFGRVLQAGFRCSLPVLLSNAAYGQVTAAAPRPAALTVDCRDKGFAISPYIYGIAGDQWDLGMTTRRWGGNPATRYNWQLGNAYNVGKDWYFENGKSDDYRKFIADSASHQVAAALTVPIIGWVAKDTTSYGFPRSVYGPQRGQDPYRNDAGDGLRPDGMPIHPGSPTQTSVEASPDSLKKWVEAIRSQAQAAGTRGVALYFLDNEPNLWNSTHRDVHPDPLSYDELLDRTIRYGSAIRAADPQAKIAGPTEWGWTGYFYSARDVVMGVEMRPDRRAHGDVPLLPWYLKKLRDHERTTGVRILDVLDVHFYPQAQDVYAPAKNDPKIAALRLRSTRALWDPTYKDESWINDTVQLIPRLRAWIAANYPGLQLSIGEYNFGGELEMSGGLALAEALGRFGSERVDYAYYWLAPPNGSPTYWAFRAYRNFDGHGGHFLERSMKTRVNSGVSLFASRDASGKHLVLVALNLDPQSAVQAKIELSGCSKPAQTKKFSYTAGAAAIAEQPMAAGGLRAETLAPYSINIFDLVLE